MRQMNEVYPPQRMSHPHWLTLGRRQVTAMHFDIKFHKYFPHFLMYCNMHASRFLVAVISVSHRIFGFVFLMLQMVTLNILLFRTIDILRYFIWKFCVTYTTRLSSLSAPST